MGVFGAYPDPSFIQPTQIWLDPLNFGASGNGTTDDTAAFTSLISQAAGANVGVILRKTFAVSTLTLPANIWLWPVSGGFKLLANATLTLNCVVTSVLWKWLDVSNSNTTVTGALVSQGVLPDWFGYSGTDNSAFWFAALTLCKSAKVPMYMLPKTYKVLSNLFGAGADAGSFNYPSIYGMGKNKSILDGSGISSGSVLKCRGGSGLPLSDTVYQGFQVLGNSGTNGIELAGCGGFRLRDLFFNIHGSGQLFHNEDASSFTEFNKLEDCEWGGCTTEIELRRTLGNDSFNSTGCQYGCIANLPNVANHAVVAIGSGCKPYNSPFNLHVQGNGSSATVFRNNSTSLESVRGEVTFEMGSATLTQADTNPLMGTIRWNGTGSSVERGTYIDARDMLLGPSAVVPLNARWAGTVALAAGTTTITSPLGAYERRVVLAIRNSTNYDYRFVIDLDGSSPGNFIVPNVPIPYNSNNGTGVGAPTLGVDSSGNLTITNASYSSSYLAYIEETQMGGTRLHF